MAAEEEHKEVKATQVIQTKETLVTIVSWGKYIVGASKDGNLCYFSRRNGALKAHFDLNLKHFYRFRNVLAIVRQDNSIALWDLETRKSVALLTGHTKWITTLHQGFVDHKILFSASADKVAMAWDIGRFTSADPSFVNPYAVKSSSSRRSSSKKKSSKKRSTKKGGMVAAAAAQSAAQSSNATAATSAGGNTERSSMTGDSGADDSSFDSTTDASDSSMGEWIDSATESTKSMGVKVLAGVTFKGHSDVVTALVVTDVDAIFTASADKSIKRWTKLGKCVETLTGHTGMVTHMHLYGGTLISVSRDQTLRTWDVSNAVNPGGKKTKGMLKKKKKTKSSVIELTCAATRLDAFESLIMLPSTDNAIRSFNMSNWKQLGTCSGGHTAKITSIACNNVNYFWSAGEDRQICKWASLSGKLLCIYSGHKAAVHQLHIANSALYSTSSDGTIRVWSQRLNKEAWFFGDIGPESEAQRKQRKDGLEWYTGGSVSSEREAQAQEEKDAHDLSWYM